MYSHHSFDLQFSIIRKDLSSEQAAKEQESSENKEIEEQREIVLWAQFLNFNFCHNKQQEERRAAAAERQQYLPLSKDLCRETNFVGYLA